jgi:hypothetical protein
MNLQSSSTSGLRLIDLIVGISAAHMAALDEFERKLLKRYEITNLGSLTTFCGINTYRNGKTGDMWLSQQDYINAIYHRFPEPKPFTKAPVTPLPLEVVWGCGGRGHNNRVAMTEKGN